MLIIRKQSNVNRMIWSIFIITIITIVSYYCCIVVFIEASTQQRRVVATARGSNHRPIVLPSSTTVSLQSGIIKFIQQRWLKATSIAKLEQSVDDWNSHYIASCGSDIGASIRYRRLIILPLDDRFNPPVGIFSHNHIQTGDKVCLPSNFWPAIQINKADVPWLFSIKRIPGITSPRVVLKKTKTNRILNKNKDKQTDNDEDDDDDEEEMNEPILVSEYTSLLELDTVVGGPLDFRAPSCYIFVPYWMMRALGVRPLDIVDVELITTVVPGSLAKFRPHSSEFTKDISNPQAVLETELRHYSSLTVGSTIAFDYNKKRYWFDVVECRSAPRGEKQSFAIKVQDCDIATDFLPAKDTLKKRSKKNKKKKND